MGAGVNGDLNGRQSRDWDEGENATARRFQPRSNENKELKERAMPRRATTIFSEVSAAEERRNSLAFPDAAVRPSSCLPHQVTKRKSRSLFSACS